MNWSCAYCHIFLFNPLLLVKGMPRVQVIPYDTDCSLGYRTVFAFSQVTLRFGKRNITDDSSDQGHCAYQASRILQHLLTTFIIHRSCQNGWTKIIWFDEEERQTGKLNIDYDIIGRMVLVESRNLKLLKHQFLKLLSSIIEVLSLHSIKNMIYEYGG